MQMDRHSELNIMTFFCFYAFLNADQFLFYYMNFASYWYSFMTPRDAIASKKNMLEMLSHLSLKFVKESFFCE